MFRIAPARTGLLASLIVSLAAGCGGGERAPLPGSGAARDGATASRERPEPPARPATEENVPLPLKLRGIGSKAELDRALARLDDETVRARFEEGFRSCFVADRSRRNYAAAVPAMDGVLASVPDFAPAYRVLAYAHFSLSFDLEKATAFYEEAVEADPEYGEAHYALSFMLTQFDLVRGRRHFERAMELGVPDERNLRGQFYR